MDKTRAHLFIDGYVQGVFFRAFTTDKARLTGVSGWVRNLPDGRVEALFEGEQQAVEEMIRHCKNGPPGARVTDVDVNWEEFKSEFTGFDIRY